MLSEWKIHPSSRLRHGTGSVKCEMKMLPADNGRVFNQTQKPAKLNKKGGYLQSEAFQE